MMLMKHEDETAKIPAPEPPRFLGAGYALASLANALAALLLLWNIGSINTAAPTLFGPADASKQIALRYRPNILATYTAGALGHLFLGAGTCHILANSVGSGRLRTSGTYQRLTMGTLLFGTVGLFSLPGEAGGCLPSPTLCGGAILAMQLAKMLVALASFVGWECAAGGFGARGQGRMKNIVSEIGRGCKSVWKTMPVTDQRPATFYRTFFVLLTLGNLVFNIPELVFNLQSGMGLFSLPVSLTLSSIARLGLLSSILYVLKDAAERKRLEGGTFIKLNLMVGLFALGVGIAQGLGDGPFNARKAADKLLFGILFLNNGILSQLAKMGVIQKRDEVDPDADPPLRIIL
ncbi:hypothetical protein ACHAXT_001825 [Thalassiosira profunda]